MSPAVTHALTRPFRGVRNWHSALPPIRRVLNWAVVGLVAAGLVAAGIVTLTPDRSCGAGVDKRADDGECTGVTDGGYSFTAGLGPVSDRIKAENTKVTKSGKAYATIALMIPMTFKEEDVAERAQVVREVQGAYLAQFRANHESGDEPPIRLVLANPGRDMTRWKEVSDQLAGMAHSGKDRLRAVFGFNLSVTRTERTIA